MPRAPVVSSQSIRSEILYLRYKIDSVNRHAEAAQMPIYCIVETMKARVKFSKICQQQQHVDFWLIQPTRKVRRLAILAPIQYYIMQWS